MQSGSTEPHMPVSDDSLSDKIAPADLSSDALSRHSYLLEDRLSLCPWTSVPVK